MSPDGLIILARTFQSEIEIVAFLEEGLGTTVIQEMQQRLLQQPGVGNVSYVSKDDALQEFRTQLGEDSDLLDVLDENPLPASLRIQMLEAAQTSERLGAMAAWLREVPGIEEVRYGDEWIKRLERYVRAFLVLDLVLGGLVVVSALFVVSNTVRLTVMARERSIEVMRLVGATDWFMRTPFVVEGALQGAAAAGLAMAVLWSVHRYATRFVGPLIFYDAAQIAGFVASGTAGKTETPPAGKVDLVEQFIGELQALGGKAVRVSEKDLPARRSGPSAAPSRATRGRVRRSARSQAAASGRSGRTGTPRPPSRPSSSRPRPASSARPTTSSSPAA